MIKISTRMTSAFLHGLTWFVLMILPSIFMTAVAKGFAPEMLTDIQWNLVPFIPGSAMFFGSLSYEWSNVKDDMEV